MKPVVTDDIVEEMGGEATKCQDNDDKMEFYWEEDIVENEMAVGALVPKFMLAFLFIFVYKKSIVQ